MPVHVLLADDEPMANRRLLRFLRAEPDVEVVAECGSGAEAVEALRTRRVDLALLDVQMPALDGFGVIEQVGPERMPPVIFVTAYDAHALKAFEVHALDYLLKPVTARRFREAFARAREHLERESAATMAGRLRALLAQVLRDDAPRRGAAAAPPVAVVPVAARPRGTDRLPIKADGRVFVVRASEIDWFEASGSHVRVHMGKASHLIRATVSALEASLDPARFARIHRGTIVNLDRIKELQPWLAGDFLVLLKDGTQLKLSRTFRDQLQARLGVLG
jgi:two-component system LytT family response regulator